MNDPTTIRKSRVKNATRVMATTAVWLIGVAGFGMLIFLGVGPRTRQYSTLTVLSGSMRPGIPVGAVVVDTPQPPSALRVGQIITYAIPVDDHHIISHRVVKIVTGGDRPVFVTKGDANDAVDPWQAQATGETMWRVRAVIPGLGTAIHGLRRPIVHQIGVLVFPAVLAVSWLVSIWREEEPDSPAGPEVPAPPLISVPRLTGSRRWTGRVLRYLAVTSILTIAMIAGMPAALASFTGTAGPTEAISPHALTAPTSFSCSGISLSVHLTWANTDNTVNPYGNNTIDGYVLEHNINGAGWTEVLPKPGPTATGATDTSFVTLVNAPVIYRIHSFKSTFWVSSVVSGGFTAHVTATAGTISAALCS